MQKKNVSLPNQKEIKEPSLAVVVTLRPNNDDSILGNNLQRSPLLAEKHIPLIIERDCLSVPKALNSGIEQTTADIVIFAHQDVYFPRGWEKKLYMAIQTLEQRGKKWGVLGVIGADKNGKLVGGAWSTGMRLKIESTFTSPAPVRSFDEIVLILQRNNRLRFDDDLPSWHLYGTDIALSAIKMDLGAYVFDGPVVHNSIRGIKLGKPYSISYKYMQQKWWEELPVYTLTLPITRSKYPLFRNWLREKKKWVVRQFRPMPPRVRHPDPAGIAKQLGYESDID